MRVVTLIVAVLASLFALYQHRSEAKTDKAEAKEHAAREAGYPKGRKVAVPKKPKITRG